MFFLFGKINFKTATGKFFNGAIVRYCDASRTEEDDVQLMLLDTGESKSDAAAAWFAHSSSNEYVGEMCTHGPGDVPDLVHQQQTLQWQ